MKERYNRLQWLNIIAFLIVPLLSSFISTYHIVKFFELGNYTWMAVVLAVAFELGAIASALSITVLDKVSKFAVWAMFIVLTAFQMIGNVYYTYRYIVIAEEKFPEYLDIASKFLMYFNEFETPDDLKIFLSILIGIPIPLISLAFLKTLVDYVGNSGRKDSVPFIDEEPEMNEEPSVEEETVDTINNVVNDTDEEDLEDDDLDGLELNTDDEEEVIIEEFVEESKAPIEEPLPEKVIETPEKSKAKNAPKIEREDIKLEDGDAISKEDLKPSTNLPSLKKEREQAEIEEIKKENEELKKNQVEMESELEKLFPQAYGESYKKKDK